MDCFAEPTVGGLISENISKCYVESMHWSRQRSSGRKFSDIRGQAVVIFSKL